VIETLTTGGMIPSGNNGPPADVSTQCNYWTNDKVDTSAGELLFTEGIIPPVVSVSSDQ
jgi:hypothetical protein